MSRKRQLDSDDEEPWRPQRHTSVLETISSRPAELVPGVGMDDLPIADQFATDDAIRRYQDMPVVRKLDWRMSPSGRPNRRSLTNKISLAAAFIQSRGQEISDPCFNCQKRLGPWETCVTMPDEEDSKLAGSCANCQFSRKYNCSFRAIKIEDFEDVDLGGGWEPTHEKKDIKSEKPFNTLNNASEGSDEANNIGSELHDGFKEGLALAEMLNPIIDDESRSLRTRSISLLDSRGIEDPDALTDPAENGLRPQNSVETQHPPESSLGSLKSLSRKEETEASMTNNPSSCNMKSKLDGDLLPFPLGPRAFDNLPLLKQAEKDTAKHLEAIQKRVRELEVKEKQKGSYNPWDFI